MKGLGLYFEILGLALALCGLLVLAGWLVRRLRGLRMGELSGAIEVKAVKPLTYKSQLILVEVLGHRLLIGVGEGGPRLICELEKKDAQDQS